MLVGTQIVDDEVILTIWGQVIGGDISETLEDLMRQGHRGFVLDLKHASIVDSAALGEIVRLHVSVSRRGGRLRLVNLSSRITELLSVTKLLEPLSLTKPLPWAAGADRQDGLKVLLWCVGFTILLMLAWIVIGRRLQP